MHSNVALPSLGADSTLPATLAYGVVPDPVPDVATPSGVEDVRTSVVSPHAAAASSPDFASSPPLTSAAYNLSPTLNPATETVPVPAPAYGLDSTSVLGSESFQQEREAAPISEATLDSIAASGPPHPIVRSQLGEQFEEDADSQGISMKATGPAVNPQPETTKAPEATLGSGAASERSERNDPTTITPPIPPPGPHPERVASFGPLPNVSPSNAVLDSELGSGPEKNRSDVRGVVHGESAPFTLQLDPLLDSHASPRAGGQAVFPTAVYSEDNPDLPSLQLPDPSHVSTAEQGDITPKPSSSPQVAQSHVTTSPVEGFDSPSISPARSYDGQGNGAQTATSNPSESSGPAVVSEANDQDNLTLNTKGETTDIHPPEIYLEDESRDLPPLPVSTGRGTCLAFQPSVVYQY